MRKGKYAYLKNKSYTIFLLSAFIIQLLTINSFATDTNSISLNLETSKNTVSTNDTVDISIILNGTNYLDSISGVPNDVSNLTAILKFDSSAFEISSDISEAITIGSENTLNGTPDYNDTYFKDPNIAYVALWSGSCLGSNSGGEDNKIEMVTFHFRVKPSAIPKTYTFSTYTTDPYTNDMGAYLVTDSLVPYVFEEDSINVTVKGSGNTMPDIAEIKSDDTEKLIDAINGSNTNVICKMQMGNTLIKAEVFKALKNYKEKSLIIDAEDYKWYFQGDTISLLDANTFYDMGLVIKWKSKNEIANVPKGSIKDDIVAEIKLNHNGALPGQMILEFNTGKSYHSKALELYYLNQSGETEYYGTISVDEAGMIRIPFKHASSYLLTEKRILTDVEGHWAYNSIMDMVARNVVSGYEGIFNPDGAVTRAEFSKMIAVAFGYEPTKFVPEFSDVKSSDWYYNYVTALYEDGIVNGKGDGLFGSDDKMTREQMAVMIYRVIKDKGYKLSKVVEEKSFDDNDMISGYAAEAVNKLRSLGIINGKNGNTFSPNLNSSKAEVVTIIDRLISKTEL